MPSAESSEAAFLPTRSSLLSRLRNLEDDASWRDFFETYWRLIYRAARQSGLSEDEAEDVVQETVLAISSKIQKFRYDPARGSFKGWLLQATRWKVLAHLRKQQRDLARQRPPGDSPDDASLEMVADPAISRLEQLWEAEWQQNLLSAAVERIRRQVKPKHFQIFELYALKEWPAGKVARILGVNLAQVHLVKHRVGNLVKKEVRRLQDQGI